MKVVDTARVSRVIGRDGSSLYRNEPGGTSGGFSRPFLGA